jgi:hypothetical protein
VLNRLFTGPDHLPLARPTLHGFYIDILTFVFNQLNNFRVLFAVPSATSGPLFAIKAR